MPPKEAMQASKRATLCLQMDPSGHHVSRGARTDAIWDYLGQLWEPKRATLYPQRAIMEPFCPSLVPKVPLGPQSGCRFCGGWGWFP